MITSKGAEDFDFIYGRWKVRNQKLRDPTDPDCRDWVEFDATSEAYPILHHLGHIDRIKVPRPPDGDPFEGLTLRLFDPATDTWSIWWTSTRAPGRLDRPVTGRFDGGHGVFECDDVLAGRPVKVRFDWLVDVHRPVWEQSFSYDGGDTWTPNWSMTLTRHAH